MKNILASFFAALLLSVAGTTYTAAAEEDATATTVLGPRNAPLAEGAQALIDRDAQRGVELTLRGLAIAQGRRERQAALANLCAGYVLLDDLQSALDYCNRALTENERNWRAYSNRALVFLRLGRHEEAAADVERGQALAPRAENLKVVKGLLLDETQPVAPTIVIDDRRDQGDDAQNDEDQ